MGIFSKRSVEMESKEYGDLSKKIADLDTRVTAVAAKADQLSTLVASLRGIINRKISNEEVEESKDLNNPVILPYNGSFK